ncbi:MAG: lysylphosphatidylglycerol synthase transmembrane domain-containing protein [Rhodospirillales bacterium]
MSKKWLALALKFLVSGLLIWVLFANIDLGEAKARLLQADPRMLALAVGVLVVQMFIAGLRWATVLKAMGTPLPLLKATQLFYIGVFFNQALPSSVGGDAVRMYKAYREGLGLRGAINGVILERVVVVLALVGLVAATQPWFLPRVDEATRAVILPGIVLAAVGAGAGLAFLMLLDRLPEALRRWRLIRGLGHLARDARKVFLRPGALIPALAWGVATHVNVSLYAFVLAVSLDLDVTVFDCLTLIPPVMLVMTVPISIAGWGVRETAMVVLFALIGVPKEGALVLSVLFGLVGMAFAIPGGAVWLASRDKGERVVALSPAMEGAADAPPDPTPGPTPAADGGGGAEAGPPGRAN